MGGESKRDVSKRRDGVVLVEERGERERTGGTLPLLKFNVVFRHEMAVQLLFQTNS